MRTFVPRSVVALALGATAACGGAAPIATPAQQTTSAPPSAAATASAECAVWAREVAFAKAAADHDVVAFTELVHPSAVFVEGDGSYTRGREAVVASWRPIIDGKQLRIAWHPSAVAVAGDGSMAISRGPYVFEDLRPDAKQRFRRGTYQSVWVKDKAGVWRVLVDGGTPPPVPASDDEAKKLEAEMRANCPAK